MNLYTFLTFLGAAGLVTMALQGIGAGHSGGGHGHGGHGTGGHGHGGGHAGGHGTGGGHAGGHGTGGGHAVGHASGGAHGHAGHAHVGSHGQDAGHGHSTGHGHGHESAVGRALWSFASPRVLFTICLGAGAIGPLLRPIMGNGTLLLIAALGVGVIFDRIIVTPVWNLAFRFASKPALMLESCVDDEATAVTAFDQNGQGLVAVDLDGQVVQLLATLGPDDRALGAAVRAGDRVRVAAVNSNRNSCTVSVI